MFWIPKSSQYRCGTGFNLFFQLLPRHIESSQHADFFIFHRTDLGRGCTDHGKGVEALLLGVAQYAGARVGREGLACDGAGCVTVVCSSTVMRQRERERSR